MDEDLAPLITKVNEITEKTMLLRKNMNDTVICKSREQQDEIIKKYNVIYKCIKSLMTNLKTCKKECMKTTRCIDREIELIGKKKMIMIDKLYDTHGLSNSNESKTSRKKKNKCQIYKLKTDLPLGTYLTYNNYMYNLKINDMLFCGTLGRIYTNRELKLTDPCRYKRCLICPNKNCNRQKCNYWHQKQNRVKNFLSGNFSTTALTLQRIISHGLSPRKYRHVIVEGKKQVIQMILMLLRIGQYI